jgi:hypothetical protein
MTEGIAAFLWLIMSGSAVTSVYQASGAWPAFVVTAFFVAVFFGVVWLFREIGGARL